MCGAGGRDCSRGADDSAPRCISALTEPSDGIITRPCTQKCRGWTRSPHPSTHPPPLILMSATSITHAPLGTKSSLSPRCMYYRAGGGPTDSGSARHSGALQVELIQPGKWQCQGMAPACGRWSVHPVGRTRPPPSRSIFALMVRRSFASSLAGRGAEVTRRFNETPSYYPLASVYMVKVQTCKHLCNCINGPEADFRANCTTLVDL